MINLKSYNSVLNESNFIFDPKAKYPDKTFGLTTGSTNSGKVVLGGENRDWGGSMQRALAFAKVANDFVGKNIISSQKRKSDKTASGKISDHSDESPNSYGVDLSCSGSQGDKILAVLMEWAGYPEYKGGYWFNFTKDGYRYQIGWRVPDHFDHIHIGVRKVNGPDSSPKFQLPLSKTGGTDPVTVKTLPARKTQDLDFDQRLKKFKEFLSLKGQ